MSTVFLAIPTYGQVDARLLANVTMMSRGLHAVHIDSRHYSLLTANFNMAWVKALNSRQSLKLDYFVMCHADVVAEAYWLDKLIAEQEATKADMLSVVVPIKDKSGATSTALISDAGGLVHRLTLSEAYEAAGTLQSFSVKRAAAVAQPAMVKPVLLVNTGLFVVDFRQPWVEQIHFRQVDTIVRHDDGEFEARWFPEDWNFSCDAVKLGAKVMATVAVKIKHIGQAEWSNDILGAWGAKADVVALPSEEAAA